MATSTILTYSVSWPATADSDGISISAGEWNYVTTIPASSHAYNTTLLAWWPPPSFTAISTILSFHIPKEGAAVTPKRIDATSSSASATISPTSTASSTSPTTTGPPPATTAAPTGTQSPLTSPTTSSQASSSTTATTSQQNHVSSGAAAGIGIGCALIGALLAAGILWFLRRRKRAPSDYRKAGGEPREKGKGPEVYPLTKTGTMSSVEAALPPPTQDSDIASEMGKLAGVIKNHAQSYYGNNATMGRNTELQNYVASLLGMSSPLSAQTLVDLLSDPSTTTAGIRFLLGWSILKNVAPSCPPEDTLLPPEIAQHYSRMRATGDDATTRSMMSRWRQITANLLKDTYSNNSISSKDPRQRNVQNLVAKLDEVLCHFASQPNDQRRLQNLEELVKRGTRFGYTLFSQPTDWSFDWGRPQSNKDGNVIVYPALVQTGDEEGRRHNVEIRLTEIQTVSVAGGRN